VEKLHKNMDKKPIFLVIVFFFLVERVAREKYVFFTKPTRALSMSGSARYDINCLHINIDVKQLGKQYG
jgi:hypothetical protein